MYSKEDELKYFVKFENQVKLIIDINYDKKLELIYNKINDIIKSQNSKVRSLRLELDYSKYEKTGLIHLYLKKYVRMRGSKKLFQTELDMKKRIRQKRLDDIDKIL